MTPTLKKIASNDQLPSQADVVVIGGGIIGACASYFLAKQGYSVALNSQAETGGGADSKTVTHVNFPPRDWLCACGTR